MNDDYRTPSWIVSSLFSDWFDPCPFGSSFDGLAIPWKNRTFCNPPYSQIPLWVNKAISEYRRGVRPIALLLPKYKEKFEWWYYLRGIYGNHLLVFDEDLFMRNPVVPSDFESALVILS